MQVNLVPSRVVRVMPGLELTKKMKDLRVFAKPENKKRGSTKTILKHVDHRKLNAVIRNLPAKYSHAADTKKPLVNKK